VLDWRSPISEEGLQFVELLVTGRTGKAQPEGLRKRRQRAVEHRVGAGNDPPGGTDPRLQPTPRLDVCRVRSAFRTFELHCQAEVDGQVTAHSYDHPSSD
jgi:hypothetical protein